MPVSAHTLADGGSACVRALARMCKEGVGGGLVFIELSLCRRVGTVVKEGEGNGDGEGGGASSSGRGRGRVIVSLISCRRRPSEDEDEGAPSFSARERTSSLSLRG